MASGFVVMPIIRSWCVRSVLLRNGATACNVFTDLLRSALVAAFACSRARAALVALLAPPPGNKASTSTCSSDFRAGPAKLEDLGAALALDEEEAAAELEEEAAAPEDAAGALALAETRPRSEPSEDADDDCGARTFFRKSLTDFAQPSLMATNVSKKSLV